HALSGVTRSPHSVISVTGAGFHCCAAAAAATRKIVNKAITRFRFIVIFSLDGYSIHTPEGLDGEEIESVCESKGLTLRPTHAEFVWYTLPDQRRSSRKGEKQFLILENQG